MAELARCYDLSRNTISIILRRNQVPIRPFKTGVPEQPVSFRVGCIIDELNARTTHRTPRGYAHVILRDIQRYYAMMMFELDPEATAAHAREDYEDWLAGRRYSDYEFGSNLAQIDAYERAYVLVTEGADIDTALREVGLVK